jgi:hypothetical protein
LTRTHLTTVDGISHPVREGYIKWLSNDKLCSNKSISFCPVYKLYELKQFNVVLLFDSGSTQC